MKREEIEKAAIYAIHQHYNCNGKYPCTERDYCRFCAGSNTSYDCNECGADDFSEGFSAGANWRINSVWHPISEEPGYGKHILVHFRSGNFTSWFASADILSMFKMFEVEEWAYVEDLLPTKDE